jgi:ubiquinone/menaquinone biosynthesis C-methylase UbiE
MSTNPIQNLYTQKAKLYQFFFVDLLKWGKVLNAFFRENNYLHPGMRILDAGCGTGVVTSMLYNLTRERGIGDVTFHGFDLSAAMLDLFRQWIKKENAQEIQLCQANVLELEGQLPQDWIDYDLIVTSAMLEYLPKEKLSQALGNLRRLLKSNGLLLAFVTRQTRISSWLGKNWWQTNLFDQEELEAELRKAGFAAFQKKKLTASWDSYIMAIEAA